MILLIAFRARLPVMMIRIAIKTIEMKQNNDNTNNNDSKSGHTRNS